ncbi:Sap, sulfolipid-1-addressing protein [Nocardioides lianchengensis]|uniref:Sap, sulfolipid-1-addressing protein n=1 Tax=Nocardioides lianchengensis TaxID=1045774 RepID=A0A1G6W2H4_9ACTN|nr:Sap, sulfolipid-1-addressing protein [Nocardioides lianchengensis]
MTPDAARPDDGRTVWELATQLVPEMLGLLVTPAAVVACLLLLGSSHPFRNVAALAGSFLAVYAGVSVLVLALGEAAGTTTDDPSTARGGISLGAGVLFLAAGAWSWAHSPARTGSPPGWVVRLRDPAPRLVVGAGLLLAAVNPNIAILASGLGIVLTSDAGTGARLGGVGLLLAASMLDFAVPTLVFVVAGRRGRRWLRDATGWLLAHNRAIGVVVLVAFGLLFVGRGLAQLAG